ncbi:hypothetical protein CDD81_8149 [Ophiocordyceps australis]|uniref:HOOK N-terminal domain-containing protein n=1 Tax=Ophiocordyceps australis TaxID=1399860 RepID=A0A2C5XGB2_9HYPO|nr:hypothetical protein CDD81_8149 [Ophiocordyceps australis]
MPPSYSPRAQSALLKTVNRVFNLDRTAESLDELTNGIILAHVLHELDPEFDPSHLESNSGGSRYLTNKRNIQAVYKGLFRFIRRQVPELGYQAKRFNYHAVAENPEAQGLSQLLAVMLSAAAMGPDNEKYVPRIQNGLDRDDQAEIMQVIRAVQQDIVNFKEDDDLEEAIDAVMEARDIDLVVEEQNAALRQNLENTKNRLSDYITRLEHLQQSHEELKYEKEKNDRELEVLRKATQDGASSAEAIKMLEQQVHEQMDIIARNEEAIRSYEKSKAHLESEVQKLSQKSKHADELRDEVAVYKHKAEELEKKANTAERYKQKLEAQQGLAREVQNLQYEKADLQEQLRTLASDRETNNRNLTSEDELHKMMEQSEQDLWEERGRKNQLVQEVAILEGELVRLRAQRSHDENFIRELQDQLDQGGPPARGNGPASPPVPSLQDELNDAASDEGQTNMPLELSRLKAENELLRKTLGSTSDVGLLRHEAEEQRQQKDRLQQKYNDLFEKQVVAQEQINALVSNSSGEGSQAFIEQRNRLLKSQTTAEEESKRSATLSTKVADMERELISTRAQLSAAEKGGIEAINELKGTDKLISESLKAELDRLREELGHVVNERDAQKSQLVEVLLAKDKLRREVEEGKELQEVANQTPGAADVDASEAVRKSGEKIERLRARLKERKQQLEQSELDKADLHHRLKAAQSGANAATQKAAAEQMIKNLQRENTLIATAWYDLTSRLQSNHLVLQRRHDAPRSWLNKQRHIVNVSTPRR